MTPSSSPDTGFLRVAGGDGIDTLAFSGAITMADADFRRIDGIESIRLANGATSLTLGAIAAHAIDALQVTIDGAAVTNATVTIDGSGFAPALSVNLANDAANVTLKGGSGNDLLVGGSGDDFFEGGGGADAIAGGGGNDTASYRSSALAVGVNLRPASAAAATRWATRLPVSRTCGSGQGDILTGNGGANALSGHAGTDMFMVQAVDSCGGAGDDVDRGKSMSGHRKSGHASTVSARLDALTRYCHDQRVRLTWQMPGSSATHSTVDGNPASAVDGAWRRCNAGGAGNDVYFVDNSGEGVVENPNEGNDTVFSTANLTAVGERGKSRPARRRGPARLRQRSRQRDLRQ